MYLCFSVPVSCKKTVAWHGLCMHQIQFFEISNWLFSFKIIKIPIFIHTLPHLSYMTFTVLMFKAFWSQIICSCPTLELTLCMHLFVITFVHNKRKEKTERQYFEFRKKYDHLNSYKSADSKEYFYHFLFFNIFRLK